MFETVFGDFPATWTSPHVLLALSPSMFLLFVGGPTLWLRPRFRVHRIGGFFFLVQYAFAWYYFLTDYDWYKDSVLGWTLQMNGCLQAISAGLTFTFLRKDTGKHKESPGGYYGDKGGIPYNFVLENTFYQLMTMFGFIYYSAKGYHFMRSTWAGLAFESLWVFLPYVLVRPYFPTTRFRDALKDGDNNKTAPNRRFYELGTVIIKYFYIASKHYVGYMINYARFMDVIDAADMKNVHYMTLANAGTVSCAIFLHTLRFKKLLSPRIAYSIYVVMAYTPFVGAVRLYPIFGHHWQLLAVATIGMLLNFFPRRVWYVWQVAVMALLHAVRTGTLDWTIH